MTAGLAFVAGLLVGSFANVCIHRWPLGQSVVRPRSRCPRCDSPIAWYDNVPLISFMALRGRCRNCGRHIPIRYPLVEFLNGAIYALIAIQTGTGPAAWKAAVFASMMLVLFYTDLEHLVLPDELTLSGLGLGIAVSAIVPLSPGMAGVAYGLAGVSAPQWVVSATESALAAAAFGGLLLVVAEAFYRLSGVDGLGRGDVKLMAMIAAFQGSSVALLVLLVGSVTAVLGGISGVLLKGRGWRDPLPFGSYLCGVAVAAIFVGDAILNHYWEFMLG